MREAEPSKMDAVTFCSSFLLEELIALLSVRYDWLPLNIDRDPVLPVHAALPR